ncbi:MAG: hypothetical protein J6Y16_06685 [Treponema sp.]|nr:hypothetical protein [Treponema sp.]
MSEFEPKAKYTDMAKKVMVIFIIHLFLVCFGIVYSILTFNNQGSLNVIYFRSIAFIINIIFSIIIFSLNKYDSEFGLAGFFNILSSLFNFIQQILPDGFLLPIYLNAVFSFIYLLKFTSAMSSCLFPVNESLSKSWNTFRKAIICTTAILIGCIILVYLAGAYLVTGLILILCIIASLCFIIWEFILLYKSFFRMKAFAKKIDEPTPSDTSLISVDDKNLEKEKPQVHEDKVEKVTRIILFIIIPFLSFLIFFTYKDVKTYKKIAERKTELNSRLSESELILSDAVRRDNERQIAKILNDHPEIIEESKTEKDFSIMEYALFYRKYNAVKALLDAGYNPNVRECPIILLTGYPLSTFYWVDICLYGEKDWISRNNIPFIKLFLSYNSKTEVPMHRGCPLSSSLSYMIGDEKEFPVVKLLVEEGHCDVNYTGASNFPPACFALREGNIYAAHYLIVKHKSDLTGEYARIAACALLSQLEYNPDTEEEKLKEEIIQELKSQGIKFETTPEFAEKANKEFTSLLSRLEEKAKGDDGNSWMDYEVKYYFPGKSLFDNFFSN